MRMDEIEPRNSRLRARQHDGLAPAVLGRAALRQDLHRQRQERPHAKVPEARGREHAPDGRLGAVRQAGLEPRRRVLVLDAPMRSLKGLVQELAAQLESVLWPRVDDERPSTSGSPSSASGGTGQTGACWRTCAARPCAYRWRCRRRRGRCWRRRRGGGLVAARLLLGRLHALFVVERRVRVEVGGRARRRVDVEHRNAAGKRVRVERRRRRAAGVAQRVLAKLERVLRRLCRAREVVAEHRPSLFVRSMMPISLRASSGQHLGEPRQRRPGAHHAREVVVTSRGGQHLADVRAVGAVGEGIPAFEAAELARAVGQDRIRHPVGVDVGHRRGDLALDRDVAVVGARAPHLVPEEGRRGGDVCLGDALLELAVDAPLALVVPPPSSSPWLYLVHMSGSRRWGC